MILFPPHGVKFLVSGNQLGNCHIIITGFIIIFFDISIGGFIL
jgi:hypothetical protein